GSRGATMTVVSVNPAENSLSWIGVGDVSAWLVRAGGQANLQNEGVILRGGIVGYQLPPLKQSIATIERGDWVVMATDGIHADFSENFNQHQSPQAAADRILTQHFKGTDDGLVLAAR